MSELSAENGGEVETPLAAAQIALSKAVEELQKLPRGSLSPDDAWLFDTYLAQAVNAVKAVRL